jgi:hypothetical protein
MRPPFYPRRILQLLALALCCLPATRGSTQVVELTAGDSTLYRAQGASLQFRDHSFNAGVSGGITDGRAAFGLYARRVKESVTYTAGTQDLALDLPTDVFSSGHHLSALGLGAEVRRAGSNGVTRAQLFAGAGASLIDSPYVQGFSQLAPTAVALFDRPITPHLTLSSQLIASSRLTALESVEWKPAPNFKLAATGGRGGSAHYAAVSLAITRPAFELTAAEIDAASSFERIGSQSDFAAEPVRENISLTLRSPVSHSFVLTLARQNFLIEQPNTPSAISTLNEITATGHAGPVHLSASTFHSTYLGENNLAAALSAALALTRRVQVQSSFYGSRILSNPASGNVSLVNTLHERLNSRISISETINHSGGSTTAAFGGSLLSNLITVSADYQTVYLPTRPANPFQQTLLLDLQLNLFGRASLHGSTMVSPLGKLLFTADAHAAAAIDHRDAPAARSPKLGNSILAGRVIDSAGQPILGAAIELDRTLLFTDSEGAFQLREDKPRLHTCRVALEEFLDGRAYRVVSQPLQLASARGQQAPATIVVARR